MNEYADTVKIEAALAIAFKSGGLDAAHKKAWVIDQMVRVLIGDDKLYTEWVAMHNDGEDGPESYSWDCGIAP